MHLPLPTPQSLYLIHLTVAAKHLTVVPSMSYNTRSTQRLGGAPEDPPASDTGQKRLRDESSSPPPRDPPLPIQTQFPPPTQRQSDLDTYNPGPGVNEVNRDEIPGCQHEPRPPSTLSEIFVANHPRNRVSNLEFHPELQPEGSISTLSSLPSYIQREMHPPATYQPSQPASQASQEPPSQASQRASLLFEPASQDAAFEPIQASQRPSFEAPESSPAPELPSQLLLGPTREQEESASQALHLREEDESTAPDPAPQGPQPQEEEVNEWREDLGGADIKWDYTGVDFTKPNLSGYRVPLTPNRTRSKYWGDGVPLSPLNIASTDRFWLCMHCYRATGFAKLYKVNEGMGGVDRHMKSRHREQLLQEDIKASVKGILEMLERMKVCLPPYSHSGALTCYSWIHINQRTRNKLPTPWVAFNRISSTMQSELWSYAVTTLSQLPVTRSLGRCVYLLVHRPELPE